MTEFTHGIQGALKRLISGSSVGLALIYTLGHIAVAITCNRIITGASMDMAAVDAFVEPIINGFWFFFLLVFI